MQTADLMTPAEITSAVIDSLLEWSSCERVTVDLLETVRVDLCDGSATYWHEGTIHNAEGEEIAEFSLPDLYPAACEIIWA